MHAELASVRGDVVEHLGDLVRIPLHDRQHTCVVVTESVLERDERVEEGSIPLVSSVHDEEANPDVRVAFACRCGSR